MKNAFEGWYYKHRLGERTLALIPGRCGSGAFIQVITNDRSYNIAYPIARYRRDVKSLRVGESSFSPAGVVLNIQSEGLSLKGKLAYSGITPISGDIMGPFRYFPMECRHSVVSMRHAVDGNVTLNGENVRLDGAIGYIEGDSGYSFPEEYAWVQYNDFAANCSIMASVARIPFAGMRFWGCVCVVLIGGREYRLATYNGAKIALCERGKLTLTRRDYRLDIAVDAGAGQALAAPRCGSMVRTIHESAACQARFRFSQGKAVLFEGASAGTSYEYAMNTKISTR